MATISNLMRLATQGILALLPTSSPEGSITDASLASATNSVTPLLRGLAYPSFTKAMHGPIDLGKEELTWTGTNKELRVNGKTFHLKGLSWFGLEVSVR